MSISREELRKLKLIEVQGRLVERDALHIAERINEYDSKLYLQYLEDAVRIDEPPYRVMEICRDGVHRVAFTAWELDERLMQRIYAADTAVTNPSENILSLNNKVRENAQRRYQEKILEAHDIAAHVVASPKTSYTYKNPDTNEIVKFE